MKKKIFLKKLDLLYISLETLTYDWNKNNNLEKKINIAYYYTNNQHYNKKQNFSLSIEYIYQTIEFITTYSLHKIAAQIIKNKKTYLKQYISKFCYSYYKNKKYYINNKSLYYKFTTKKEIDIKKDAILNLYIIYKLDKTNGIYQLTKYLKQT
uniref:Uncharacterized protein n=1 Tax=Kapraunia schneideri TaxID=717899 RepID=A0A1Z1MSZ9_9FLOR|nr:hypothetical protein [Kapraunia schneideri]ARW69009.1 hypothetical protein [Kapraunia schneideri]